MVEIMCMESVLSPGAGETKLSEDPKKPKRSVFLLKSSVYFLLIVLMVAGVVVLIKQKPELLGLSKAPSEPQKEAESLVSEVSKIIEMPAGEIPTIATVSELDKVKEQQFFKKAENGDKVLVYQNARKAYLYRPSAKKIIEVGVVNVNQNTGGQVAGESSDIPVITPTPLTTENPPSASPAPTESVRITNTPTPFPSSSL